MKKLQAWRRAWRSRREAIPPLSPEEWNRRFTERNSDPPQAVMCYTKPQPPQPPKPESSSVATPEETLALVKALARITEENGGIAPYIRYWPSFDQGEYLLSPSPDLERSLN